MTDATKVPKWAMDAAIRWLGPAGNTPNNVLNLYYRQREELSRIIAAAAAPDEVAIRRDEMRRCLDDCNGWRVRGFDCPQDAILRRFDSEHGGQKP